MKLTCESEDRGLLFPLAVSHTVVREVRVHRFVYTGAGTRGWSEVATGPWAPVSANAMREAADQLAEAVEDRNVADADDLADLLAPYYGKLPTAATLGVEMAVLDALAAAANEPLWSYLGLPRPDGAPLFTTVDLLDTDRPWTHTPGRYKVKLGGPDDAAVIASCRGTGSRFLFDVNSGWDLAEYDALAPALRECDPIGVEDPVRSLEAIVPRRAQWRRDRIFLDESVRDTDAVRRHGDAAAGINFKLLKFGGLLPVLDGIRIARAAGAEIGIGCFIEPERSIAYAGALTGLADHVDLDGDRWLTGAERSRLRLDDGPGIGRTA